MIRIIKNSVWFYLLALISVSVAENSCILKTNTYNQEINLKDLHSELAHDIPIDNGRIRFNVCGQMKRKCNNESASACLEVNGKEFVLGTESQPQLDNGRILFNFTGGGKCLDHLNYNLNIITLCSYFGTKDSLRLISVNESNCNYNIFWQTKSACPVDAVKLADQVSCNVIDKERNMNFNFISLSNSNYRITDRNNSEYIINICQPVIYQTNAQCPPGSSICYVNKTSNSLMDKFINYGNTSLTPKIVNGDILMEFNSTTKCNATHNYRSVIKFICDETNEIGRPEFLGEKNCVHNFAWGTLAACPVSASFTPCSARHPNTHQIVNLQELAERSYQVTSGNKTYFLNICNVKANPNNCGEKIGACDSNTPNLSLGSISNVLRFNESGSPYLVYDMGGVCKNINRNWSTRIEFICLPNYPEGPKIVEDTDCTLVIHFVTKLACTTNIGCKAYNLSDGNYIDLSPLISSSKNYIAIVNNTKELQSEKNSKFFINVCRPLVPQYGLSCTGGSAICKADEYQNSYVNETSLGMPYVSATATEGSRTKIMYVFGNKCPKEEETQLSSEIEFYCNVTAGKGTPVLQEVKDHCHYRFEWGTSVICQSLTRLVDETSCSVTNDQLGTTVDLRTIFVGGNISVTAKPETFQIDVCKHRDAIIDYSEGVVKLFFETKGPCSTDDSIDVELRISCSENVTMQTNSYNNTAEYYRNQESCDMVIKHSTPLVCSLVAGVVSSKNELPDPENHPASDTVTGGFLVPVILILVPCLILILAVVFIYRHPYRREQIRSLFRRESAAVHYSQVRTTEEAGLLIPQPGHISDSDDDLLI